MAPHDDHGQTPAAWTAVTIVIVAFLVGGIATVLAMPWVVAASLVLAVLGGVVGKAMAMMGMGAPGYRD